MGRGRGWTEDEIEVLRESWGNISVPAIAKKLVRSEYAVYNKVYRLGLGTFFENNGKGRITFNELVKALGLTGGSGYLKISWVQKRGLPLHKQIRCRQAFYMVDVEEFWKWAEKNQSHLDFSRFKRLDLGPEPDWVDAKRNRDKAKLTQYKPKNTVWTQDEDDRLLYYLKQQKYSYVDISKMLGRTVGAVTRRCSTLGYKERPLRESPHSPWSAEQQELLIKLILSGANYIEMQEQIGKSSKAIQGKVYRDYGTEKLDVARERLRESS